MKVQLNYTEEMKEQDLLWESQNEDSLKMQELFEAIISEANKKGLKEVCYVYNLENECICNIYNSQDDIDTGKEPLYEHALCKNLIKSLETLINAQ